MIFLLFWFSVVLLFYIYIGYPITLLIASKASRNTLKKQIFNPTVSIVIPAYNEEDVIGDTIENKLVLCYPQKKLSVYVISDASNDKTDEIVEGYASKGVTLLKQAVRRGKTAALNNAIPQLTCDIVVFSDANSLFHKDTLLHLTKNFSDPTVGYVTGKMVYVHSDDNSIGDGCTSYMKYENILRKLETRCGSVVGVDGGIDAMRRELYVPMSPDALPDFVLPLKVIEKGYRVVYEPEAIVKEGSLSSTKDEYKMRVRVSLRAFHALYMMKHLFNPFKYGLFSFQLFVHKFLRYLAGLFMLIAFILNLIIVGSHSIYMATLVLQVIFYLLAGIGYLRKDNNANSFTYIPFYFFLLNFSSLVAFLQFCTGKKQTIWEPRKG